MDNYRKLVEKRFSQMLEDEKSRLRREHNQKKDLLEKQLRFENEERLAKLQDNMKSEFGHSQRISENRHQDQIMSKERELQLKLEDMSRRMEQEAIAREQTIEDKLQNRLRH